MPCCHRSTLAMATVRLYCRVARSPLMRLRQWVCTCCRFARSPLCDGDSGSVLPYCQEARHALATVGLCCRVARSPVMRLRQWVCDAMHLYIYLLYLFHSVNVLKGLYCNKSCTVKCAPMQPVQDYPFEMEIVGKCFKKHVMLEE